MASDGDPRAGIQKGRLTFTLHGEKLRGRWHLVKTKGDAWLLFKGRDDAANDEVDIVAAEPRSVVSGKTIEQIAAAPARVWHSNRAVQGVPIKPAQNQNELFALLGQLPLGYKLTNLDKVLYPGQGITKGDLIAYLAVVSDWMLPHVARRPLTIVRCPEGMVGKGRRKPCFFQKQLLAGSPSAITAVPLTEDNGEVVSYMQVQDMAGLVALAQLGTLEIHTWGAHADAPERPDLMVFDLDPDVGLPWERVALAAFEVRRRLRELGLDSFVKTTGGKGLHVAAPVERRLDWDAFKAFTKAFVEQLERAEPSLYTTNIAKRARKGKIFLDYLRNGRNATFIAPYSPRARPNAPVAVPISWEELAAGVDPAAFTTVTVPRRLATIDRDPWAAFSSTKQTISAAARRAIR